MQYNAVRMANSVDEETRKRERVEDIHRSNIAVAFANETFTIGMLHAVSGASLFAALAQWEPLTRLTGRVASLILLTAMGIGLIAAGLAAYSKHQYKMWDVKANASAMNGQTEEANKRMASAQNYLTAMRRSILLAALAIALGFLLVVAWVRAFCTISP